MVLRIFITLCLTVFAFQQLAAQENSRDHNHNDQAEDRTIPMDALPSLERAVPGDVSEEDDSVQIAKERDGKLPTILRDLSALPDAVRETRERILKSARSGDLESLRANIGTGESATSLSIGETDGDPIDFLKEQSGDEEGFEILGILVDVLEAGYVHLNDTPDEEMYVWPYFFAVPLDQLTKEQKVELYRVLTAGDVEESREMGSYVFYRVGIKPDGRWDFFLSGS